MRLAKLKGRIYEKYGNLIEFEEATGLAVCYMSRLLNGKHMPSWATMKKLIDILEIDSTEVGNYFFPKSIENS